MLPRLLLTVALAVACVSVLELAPPPVPLDGETYWPDAAWRTAEPEQVGLDGERLRRLVRRIRSGEVRGLHSLVVVRHGYLAVEEYFNGSGASDVHTMQSVSKSVTSLLVGIAAGQGLLRLGDSVTKLFPQYTALQALDDRKRGVTVRDLLTMRSGIDFYETPYDGSPLQALNTSSSDWVKIVLDRPMNDDPGHHWQYNSGGVIVLAGVLRGVTGMSPVEFARRQLFEPLGISTARWYVSAFDGLPHTGGGLSVRAQDLARIGYLVLRHGKWKDRQIVPEQWLTESVQPTTSRPRTFAGHATDYGYLWWLLPRDGAGATGAPDNTIYTASGNLNQWLFIVPNLDLVVAITGGSNESAPVDFLYRDILTAIR